MERSQASTNCQAEAVMDLLGQATPQMNAAQQRNPHRTHRIIRNIKSLLFQASKVGLFHNKG